MSGGSGADIFVPWDAWQRFFLGVPLLSGVPTAVSATAPAKTTPVTRAMKRQGDAPFTTDLSP